MRKLKTKQIVAAGLSALMMMCSATSVFAAEPDSKTNTLNYQVTSRYDWMIHSAIDFGADAGTNKTVDRTGNQVKVLKNVIPEGKYLNISVKGSGANDAFTVDNGGSEVLNYDVSDDNGAVGVNGNVLSVPACTNTATQNMGFKLNTTKKSAEVAGQYNGRVIYNAELGGKDDIIQKEKSSKLITGEEFNKKIPSSATTVVFTNEKAPEGVETTSLSQEGDVVGWLDGTTWKVSTQDFSKVVNFNENSSEMFSYKKGLTNINFNNVDTSNATDMWGMFFSCTNLTSLDLSSFDALKVTDMHQMFNGCSNLASLNLSSFDTTKVTDMSEMFECCKNLTSLDLSSFNTSNVTSMSRMFMDCSNLTSLNLNSFDTSNVIYMYSTFAGCSNLTSLNLSSFDTSKATKMYAMFNGCSNLASLNLSSFSTSNVTDMSAMFYDCSKLTSLNLSNFNTSKVADMNKMFYKCTNLSSLDLSDFDTSKVTKMTYMFSDCSNLTNIYVSPKWSTNNVDNMWINDGEDMFVSCKKLPNYDASVIDVTKAHTGSGGYLTLKQ